MNRRSGFTLVELVVVILILGILAGVAAPKFFQASGSAADNGAKQSLAIVRDAIELYAAQNGGNLPTCTTPGADFKALLATYIRGSFPVCPVGAAAGSSTIFEGAATTANVHGWRYNALTGEFFINSGAASSVGGNYDTW